MTKHTVETLISAQALAAKVDELAAQIAGHYEGKELLVIGILKGAFVFCADLIRALPGPTEIDFMAVSSYGAATESSGTIRILKDLDQSIEGKHVLLVEDIVDSGLTLRYLQHYLQGQQPASLKTCVLLDKPSRRQVEVPVDFRGFVIPDAFVVGYGIDWAERYRNLPYIGAVKMVGEGATE